MANLPMQDVCEIEGYGIWMSTSSRVISLIYDTVDAVESTGSSLILADACEDAVSNKRSEIWRAQKLLLLTRQVRTLATKKSTRYSTALHTQTATSTAILILY